MCGVGPIYQRATVNNRRFGTELFQCPAQHPSGRGFARRASHGQHPALRYQFRQHCGPMLQRQTVFFCRGHIWIFRFNRRAIDHGLCAGVNGRPILLDQFYPGRPQSIQDRHGNPTIDITVRARYPVMRPAQGLREGAHADAGHSHHVDVPAHGAGQASVSRGFP